MPTRLLCLLALGVVLRAVELGIAPALQRLDLRPDQVAEAVCTITAAPRTTVSAVIADCACIRTLTTLPVAVGDNGRLDIRLRVTGMRPGVEDILVATSAGILRAQVQIVGAGAGRGRDQVQAALAEAAARGLGILAIAHDLRGQVRHCGCSLGALGGIGRLARLPGLAAELRPGVACAWLLSGDADGMRSGVGELLAGSGWLRADPRVRVAADPLPALAQPGVVAVIPTVAVAVEHRRIIRPVLTEGMAVELLLLDAAGAIQGRRTVPVDDSLPDDPALAARFADPLTRTLQPQAQPSQDCRGCHAGAYAAWAASRHARALDSLPAADRTDACVGCHTQPLPGGALAPMVGCQSCHTGTAVHAASAGRIRTTGTVDCRGCHDAKHHPTFRRDAAWELIRHGR